MSRINFQKTPITLSLISINVFIFFLPLLFAINVFEMNVQTMYELGAMEGFSLIVNHELWRLGSSLFLHGNLGHLVMNMVTLLFIGSEVEKLFSRFTYLSVYFISGLISGLVPIYFQEVGTVSLGASGAIFGVAGIMIGFTMVHYQKMKDEFLDYMKGYAIFLGINLMLGLSMPEVGFTAHLTGFIVGILGGMFLHNKYYYSIFVLLMLLGAYYLYAIFLPTLYVSSTSVLF